MANAQSERPLLGTRRPDDDQLVVAEAAFAKARHR
jgi:hypothetical protein